MKKNVNFNSLYFTKIILSIMVIAIHVKLFKGTSAILNMLFSNGICRVAMPLFFVIAGYLFIYGINKSEDKKKHLKNIYSNYSNYI